MTINDSLNAAESNKAHFTSPDLVGTFELDRPVQDPVSRKLIAGTGATVEAFTGVNEETGVPFTRFTATGKFTLPSGYSHRAEIAWVYEGMNLSDAAVKAAGEIGGLATDWEIPNWSAERKNGYTSFLLNANHRARIVGEFFNDGFKEFPTQSGPRRVLQLTEVEGATSWKAPRRSMGMGSRVGNESLRFASGANAVKRVLPRVEAPAKGTDMGVLAAIQALAAQQQATNALLARVLGGNSLNEEVEI